MLNWAQDLIDNGKIYFTNIEQFLNDAHSERGDSGEGTHVSIRNGSKCVTRASMPVYVWCSTLDTQPARILKIWDDKDSVIQILDTLKFAHLIHAALGKQYPYLWPLYMGPVVYTKTSGGREAASWADRIFQKDERFDSQKEFRFALTGKTGDAPREQIILNLGNCSDIIRLVA